MNEPATPPGRAAPKSAREIVRVPIKLLQDSLDVLDDLCKETALSDDAILGRALLHQSPAEGLLEALDALHALRLHRIHELRAGPSMEMLLEKAKKEEPA